MNPSMYLVAVLALCALPSALGLMCYECTANSTIGELCTNMSTYKNVTCQHENATCGRTEIISHVGQTPVKAYVLNCVDGGATCDVYNNSLCNSVITEAGNMNVTVSSCMTTCCKDMDKCNTVPTEPPPTESSTGSTTATSTMSTTTAAADMFRPHLLALLFTILAIVGAQ